MSNTTETMPETTIRIDPVPGRGQRRVRVAVMQRRDRRASGYRADRQRP